MPSLSVQETSSTILIYDKEGILGELLAKRLISKHLVIFVSSHFDPDFKDENLIKVYLKGRIPQIPENKYSYIFIFDDGKEVLKTIQPFLEKSQIDKTPLVLISNVTKLSPKIYDQILDTPQRVKLLIAGDVFGKNQIYDSVSTVNRFHNEAKHIGKMLVEGEGLNYSMPVYDEDVVEKIIEVGTNETTGKVFYIFPDHPVTDISLARMFKKTFPDILLDFKKEGEERNYFLPEGGNFIFGSGYDLSEKIKHLDLSPDTIVRKHKAYEKPFKFYSFRTFWIFLILIFIILLPLISTGFYSVLGIYSLNSAKQNIEKGKLEKAATDARRGYSFFNIANKSSDLLAKEASLVGLSEQAEKIIIHTETGKEISSAGSSLIEGAQKLKDIYMGASDSPSEDFRQAQNHLKSSVTIFRKIEAAKAQNFEFLREVKKLEPIIEMFVSTDEVAEELLGFTKEKKYLILFQNNMELRPGGGFIGSFGILRIKNARIVDFEISDVYSADGQLEAHVEPPYPIRRHLPSVNWYLRDSGFDIDFPTNARNAAYLLNLETGEKIDGVIGVDVSFIRHILEATGPVEVLDYKETVNAGNFYLVTQKHTEENFFPGSTQKRDFLNSLYKSLERLLEEKNEINYFAMAQGVSQAILEKHLMFTFNNPSAQRIYSTNGWSGSFSDQREEGPGIYNDFLSVYEANLGVNKANFFVGRRAYLNVSIDENRDVSSEASVVIENKSVSWPGGDYKNYMRFIVPQNAILTNIKIDGKSQIIKDAITNPAIYEASDYDPGTDLEVENSIQHGKRVIGFITNIPKGKKQSISIEYRLPKIIFDKDRIDYRLMFFKQPGVEEVPITVRLNYPDSLRPIQTEGGMEKGRITFSEFAKSNLTFTTSFARN